MRPFKELGASKGDDVGELQPLDTQPRSLENQDFLRLVEMEERDSESPDAGEAGNR